MCIVFFLLFIEAINCSSIVLLKLIEKYTTRTKVYNNCNYRHNKIIHTNMSKPVK